MRTLTLFWLHFACAALLARTGAAQGASAPETEDTQDLKNLSIEQLMDLEVTIATRSEQTLSQVPGAVYVLTGDEIRRSGATSIPEALRMVPGFYVSHWFSQAWDVTARGFGPGLSLTSSAFLNQLIVMIDGVVVYTPLFAGTWWDIQGIDMAAVDRIEVMKGPGGSLWGTNATHGVVNVITKSSAATQGLRASVYSGGNDDHAGLSYGGKLGPTATYRAWGYGSTYDGLEDAFLDFETNWRARSAGFRADVDLGPRKLTFWSRFYEDLNRAYGFDPVNGTIPIHDKKRGYQLSASLANPEANSVLQAWFSADLQNQPTFVDISIATLDLEYQREFRVSEANRLQLGAGYRRVDSDLAGDDPTFEDFDPHHVQNDIYRAFAIDRHALPSLNSELLLGCTLEHNDFTDGEVQPTVRYTWTPTTDFALWSAITRAVRTPSLEERTLSSGSAFVGNDSFRSEKLVAYEAGARALLSPAASVDLALFFNDYDDLHFEQDIGGGQALLTNDAEGTAFGAELALDLRPTERWTVRSGYAFARGHYESKLDGSNLNTDDYYPEHQFNLRSYYDLGAHWELDGAVYMVEKMGPAFDIAEYWRVDARLGWRPSAAIDLSVGVQSLNDPQHSEFDEFNLIRQAAYISLTWTPGATTSPE
jgi:iron complex outermembrane receptor protein